MKKKLLIACIFSLVFVFGICLLVARHNHVIGHRSFPWHLAEEWYCAEIGMTLEFVMHEDGYLVDNPISVLTVGEELYEIDPAFYGTNLITFLVDENGDNIRESVLLGSWNYRFGSLVIRIRQESIFDGLYKELVFVPCDD